MANEKFIVTTTDNQFQINIRNLLCPAGYFFLVSCNDAVSLMRMVRTYSPDFVIIDVNCIDREVNRVIETMDDELLCSIILVGDDLHFDLGEIVENSIITFKVMPDVERAHLADVVDMSIISYNRVMLLSKKLKEMTDNYETRKLVERAKWILMEQNKISEKEAYERMRKKSMNTRISMKQISEAIIYTNDIKMDRS